jgi:hypothetical protein
MVDLLQTERGNKMLSRLEWYMVEAEDEVMQKLGITDDNNNI